MNPTELWNIIKDALVTFGFVNGLFLISFIGGHYWLYRMYNGRLSDRQDEIDRLAKDNREYRDRFLSVLDRHFDLPPSEPKQLNDPEKEKDNKQDNEEQK